METSSPWLLRLGALGAALATGLLVAMAFIPFPREIFYPGLEVLSGHLRLTSAELDTYLTGMHWLFVLDGLFLVGWLFAWIGIAELVRSRQPRLGGLTLIFGLAGALFDFGENSLIVGALQIFQFGQAMSADWIIAWKAVQHLSYWLPFLAAALAAPALWRGGRLEQAAAVVGSVLLIPAVIGLYAPTLALLPNLWFLLWFGIGALWLWQSAGKNPK